MRNAVQHFHSTVSQLLLVSSVLRLYSHQQHYISRVFVRVFPIFEFRSESSNSRRLKILNNIEKNCLATNLPAPTTLLRRYTPLTRGTVIMGRRDPLTRAVLNTITRLKRENRRRMQIYRTALYEHSEDREYIQRNNIHYYNNIMRARRAYIVLS